MNLTERDAVRLGDILDGVAAIQTYSAGLVRSDLDLQPMVCDGILFNILKIGEAVKALSADFRDEHPEVAWSNIAKMRDLVIHRYQHINLDLVWNVVIIELPSLRDAVRRMLDDNASRRPGSDR